MKKTVQNCILLFSCDICCESENMGVYKKTQEDSYKRNFKVKLCYSMTGFNARYWYNDIRDNIPIGYFHNFRLGYVNKTKICRIGLER